jgi:capsular polysaccharide transport system permease protein
MPSAHGFAASARVQRRIIAALVLRELLTRYGRHNIGFVWLFFEPMLFTLGIATLWSLSSVTHGSSLPIVSFAVTGYSSVLVWRNAANRCNKALQTNWALLFHRNVTPLDIFAARILLEVVGATVSLVVLSSIFVLAGQADPPEDLLTALLAWLLLGWFAFGFGLTVGALTERSDVFERIWHVAAYLLFPLSGAVFMVDWLPEAAQAVVLALPMVHGVEMLRHGWFGAVVPTHESVAYMVIWNLVITMIGLALALTTPRNVEGTQ